MMFTFKFLNDSLVECLCHLFTQKLLLYAARQVYIIVDEFNTCSLSVHELHISTEEIIICYRMWLFVLILKWGWLGNDVTRCPGQDINYIVHMNS